MQYLITTLLIVSQLLTAGYVYSQEPVQPLQRPAERPLDAPAQRQRPAPAISLPPAPTIPADKLSAALRVFVKRFSFEGNTVVSDAELALITRPYEGRQIDAEELQAVRRAVTLYYIDRGYINSGAMIPDQPVDQGVIRLRIIEGRLTGIEVSGNDWLRTAYLWQRIRLGSEQVLNIQVLKDQLFILQQDPRISQLHARLEPGSKPGESVLHVRVVEDHPLQMYFSADNHSSPSVGEGRGELTLLHNDLTGNGDTLSGQYVYSRGLDNYDISYALPLSAMDDRIRFSYTQGESRIIEQPFTQLDIKNKSRTSALAYVHPYYRTPDAIYDVSLQVETRESQTFLGGEPYSFIETAEQGKTRLSVVRLVHSWLQRYPQRIVTGRSTLSKGINERRATISEQEPDGDFVSWLGQAQWVERWPASHHELVTRGALQVSDDPLLPMEQFSIGGANTVRGYRENQLVGDNGIVVSIEYRIPIFGAASEYGRFQLAGFADYGQSRNRVTDDPKPNELYSAGLGLRWHNGSYSRFELYWAKPLRDVSVQSGSLQDEGIHLRFETRVF